MTRLPVIARLLLLVCVGFFLAGCKPLAENDADDQRNPDFLKGLSRKNAMDYKGAVEAFEAALARNPRSAGAHLELGVLYENHMSDYAAAIYHYERHLMLKPNSNVGDMLRGRIESCKLELLKSISLAAVPQQVQAQLDRLATEKMALKQQVTQLQAQLAQYTNIGMAAERPAPLSAGAPPPVVVSETMPETSGGLRTSAEPPRASRTTYTIRDKNDTFYSIAKRHGLSIEDLRAANPGVDPHRLRPGQIINVPSR